MMMSTHSTTDHTPELSTPTYFFIGIGGIGMSALAHYFLHMGYRVGGYDRARTPITQSLEERGAEIIYTDDPDLLPEYFRAPEDIRVVYTPAIHEDNHLRTYYTRHGYPSYKRSEVLGEITAQHHALCVAGTHGKTTTSTLLAHLLQSSHLGANAFLGGIALNYDSNLLLDANSPYVVVEADEYDRSFHRLHPDGAIITSMEPDHLDIYGTPEAYTEAFVHFISLTSYGGMILLHEDCAVDTKSLDPTIRVYRYGIRPTSAYYYSDIEYRDGALYFDWHTPTRTLRSMHIGSPIEINVLNATAALAIAEHVGLSDSELRSGLSTFRGVHRRFEIVSDSPNHPILIDDYAHHPDEIEASIRSIQKLYTGRRITVVFQPHLYTRTRDFLQQFGGALSLADDVILLPIYPAREAPIPGVCSEALLPHITSERKCVTEKALLTEELRHHDLEVLVMMGAGDIEFEVKRVADYLQGVE